MPYPGILDPGYQERRPLHLTGGAVAFDVHVTSKVQGESNYSHTKRQESAWTIPN